jgi:hypothetical protein
MRPIQRDKLTAQGTYWRKFRVVLLPPVSLVVLDLTEADMLEKEWVVEFDDAVAVARLKAVLLLAEQTDRRASGDGLPDDALIFVVDRFAGLRVEVFVREHSPPHFRVSCGKQSANYRLADCVQLNGNLRRYYRAVREWHAENKENLIAAWNRLRPTDRSGSIAMVIGKKTCQMLRIGAFPLH